MERTNQPDASKVCSDDYFCEVCGNYPLKPIHGHYECDSCGNKTKCCEGAPAD